MHPHGDKEDSTPQDMETLSIEDEVEVMVEEEEEEEVSYMRKPQKENLVEDGEEVAFMEMEEVEKCAKEHLKMTKEIDKLKIGLYQPIWKEGMIQDRKSRGYPLLHCLQDLLIGVV